MTIRQNIVTALKTQLQDILVVNGYQTNIGSSVEEWRVEAYDTAELPAIDIRDTDCTLEAENNLSENQKLLSVSIVITDSATTPANMRKYLDDILLAISKDVNLSGNAYNVIYQSDSMEEDQKNQNCLSIELKIDCYYLATKWRN